MKELDYYLTSFYLRISTCQETENAYDLRPLCHFLFRLYDTCVDRKVIKHNKDVH
jgi:hypothetical protein